MSVKITIMHCDGVTVSEPIACNKNQAREARRLYAILNGTAVFPPDRAKALADWQLSRRTQTPKQQAAWDAIGAALGVTP